MDMTVEEISKWMTPNRKQQPQFSLGIITEVHLDEGYYLVQVDSTLNRVRASAFCHAMVNDRVLLLIMPNGMCIALSVKNFGDSPVNPTDWVVKEGDFSQTSKEGIVLNGHIRKWSNKYVEIWFKTNAINVACGTASGSVYLSNGSFYVPYPVEFSNVSNVQAEFNAASGTAWVSTKTGSINQNTNSPSFYLVSPTNSTVNGSWNIYVSGFEK